MTDIILVEDKLHNDYVLTMVVDGYNHEKNKSAAAEFFVEYFPCNLRNSMANKDLPPMNNDINDKIPPSHKIAQSVLAHALSVTRKAWLEKKDHDSSGCVFGVVLTNTNTRTFHVMTVGDVRAVFKLTNNIASSGKKPSVGSNAYWLFGIVDSPDYKTIDHTAMIHDKNNNVLVKRSGRGKRPFVIDKARKGQGITTGASFGDLDKPETQIISNVPANFKHWEGPGIVFIATDGHWDVVDACARSGIQRYVRPQCRYIEKVTGGNFDGNDISSVNALQLFLTEGYRQNGDAWDNITCALLNMQD